MACFRYRFPARVTSDDVRTHVTGSDSDERTGDTFARDLVLYVLARLALVVVIAVPLALVPGVPLLVALIVGFFVGMPFGLLLLRPLNERVTAGLAARNERRATERARLRAELRGEDVPDTTGSDTSGERDTGDTGHAARTDDTADTDDTDGEGTR